MALSLEMGFNLGVAALNWGCSKMVSTSEMEPCGFHCVGRPHSEATPSRRSTVKNK